MPGGAAVAEATRELEAAIHDVRVASTASASISLTGRTLLW